MKKYLFLALTLFCAGGLIAQDPGPVVISSLQTGQEKQSSVSKQDADTAVGPTTGPGYAAHGESKRGQIIVAQVPAAAGASKKSQPWTAPEANGRPVSQSAPAAKKETAKTQDQDSEEGGVMIDSKSEDSEAETYSYSSKNNADQPGNAGFASSLPASYGQLKGVLNEQGRNMLVFENEDGILSFVQVSVNKNSVSLKLLARVARSQE